MPSGTVPHTVKPGLPGCAIRVPRYSSASWETICMRTSCWLAFLADLLRELRQGCLGSLSASREEARVHQGFTDVVWVREIPLGYIWLARHPLLPFSFLPSLSLFPFIAACSILLKFLPGDLGPHCSSPWTPPPPYTDSRNICAGGTCYPVVVRNTSSCGQWWRGGCLALWSCRALLRRLCLSAQVQVTGHRGCRVEVQASLDTSQML